MRKWIYAAVGLAAVCTAVAAGFVVGPRLTARAAAKQDGDEARQVQLPISQVVLFSSGVGYFQREGNVSDNARIDLTFDVRDINDLIKSMVLRDLNKGHITAVSYDSNAPIERTLKSFAIDLTGNPTLSDILNKARGEKVEVVPLNAQAGQQATATGTVIGVERRKEVVAGSKEPVEVAVLNLWCSDGIKSFKLPEVQRVRFLNALIDTEFKKALETLALSHDTQKKAVSIRCTGEGKRKIQVSYVVENPVWKTTYRLVLDTKKEEKPYLQGWAVVENPSDEDWKDVRMALISGRPISFQMNLYDPLYVTRPTMQLELFQSLRPVAYSGAMDKEKKDAVATTRPAAPMAPPGMGMGGLGGRTYREKSGEAKGSDGYYGRQLAEQLQKQMDLRSSVTSAATAAKLGDYFQYTIDKAVTLPRQKSALLPIIGKDVEATRVSIYRESTQKKFPLLGLKVKNTSGAHLMQGPITIFEGSNYAGDSIIQDLQPNEERLLSYAIDLGTEVDPVPSVENGRILSIKAVKGIVHTSIKNRQAKNYTIKNRNEVERTILVEHPVNKAFTLVGEKPTETASDVYRFEVKVPAGKSKTLTVTEEREDSNQYSFSSQGKDDDTIRMLLSQPLASKELKAGLKRVMELRWALHKTQAEIKEMERQLQTIVTDQTRLRANLKETPSDTPLHKRYIKKLEEQETQIEKYQADIKKAQTSEHEQKKTFDDFIANFSVE